VVQSALETLEGEALDVFVVWIPAIAGDRYEATDDAKTLIPDGRATHYWDGGQALGEVLSPTLGIRAKMAWDVYVLYGKDAVWDGGPPAPTSWMHQKFGEDPALELNEEQLVEKIRDALK
jgi:hypothetical protein